MPRDPAVDMPLAVREAVPLGPCTTLEVGGPARYYAEASERAELLDLLRWARQERLETLVLGGGSNVLVSDAGFAGLVVRFTAAALTLQPEAAGSVLAVAGAGLGWDALVDVSVAHDLSGIECLAGIPGACGATPTQNVGAYGQEVGQCLVDVEVVDRQSLEVRRLPAAACGLGYRTSAFRSAWRERYVITEIVLGLRRGPLAMPRYPELAAALGRPQAPPPLGEVRDAVLQLRRSKSMVLDPADSNRRSAGSFFTNPQVDAATAATLLRRHGRAMPQYPGTHGLTKLSAAWLIEQAGFARGLVDGRVGLSTRHVLALINRGGAAAADVVRLAQTLRGAVLAHSGVTLHVEPALVGFAPEVVQSLQ